MKKDLLFVLFLYFFVPLQAQVFQRINAGTPVKGKMFFTEPMPEKYSFWHIDIRDSGGIKEALAGKKADFLLRFPVPDEGRFEEFAMEMSPLSRKKWIEKYRIASFRGTSKTGKKLFLTYTQNKLTGLLLIPGRGKYILKPYDEEKHILYRPEDQTFEAEPFACEAPTETSRISGEILDDINNSNAPNAYGPQSVSNLYTFRTAILATYRYTDYILSQYGIPATAPDSVKKATVMGVILFSMEWINSIFERDLSVRFYISDQNEKIIILDSLRDPENLGISPYDMIRDSIGTANFDIAQRWDVARLGGEATLLIPCQVYTSNAARHPASERYIEKVVAHELGHTLGAHHTFANLCGGNRRYPYSVEPGSGTTIMSYSGICDPFIQKETDEIFHSVNLPAMIRTRNTAPCAVVETHPVNRSPVVDAGEDKFIPRNTPFMLRATASDPDGDFLTYSWEQTDTAPPTWGIEHDRPPQPDWTEGPLFRVYLDKDTPERYFPHLDSLRQGNYTPAWEVLPDVERDLNFKVTVRDHHYPTGLTAIDSVRLHIDTTAGPFRITSHISGEYHWLPGETHTITWDVANTTNPRVNCQFVDILYSTDDGLHFPYVLASSVPNTGSYTITVPPYETPRARIMVKASDNYFFDITQARIKVGDELENCGLSYRSDVNALMQGMMTVRDTIEVPDYFLVSDVNVRVKLDSITTNKVTVRLKRPDGSSVLLWDRHCGAHTNMDLTFDDEGITLLCAYLTDTVVKPFRGHLASYNNKDAHGKWILEVYQRFENNPMIFKEWELQFCMQYTTDVPQDNWKGIVLYPNPARDYLSVKFPLSASQKIKLTIYGMDGKRYWQSEYEGRAGDSEGYIVIPVYEWAKGIYWVRLHRDKSIYSAKFIKD